MKKIFLSLIISPITVLAQLEVGSSFGATNLIGLTKKVTLLSSIESGFYVSKDLKFKNFSFSPQINIVSSTLIMDGIFYNGNPKSFGTSPVNSKQSKIDFLSIRIPLYFKILLLESADGKKFSKISFGLTLGYVVNARQQYKIDDKIIKENAPLDYRINSGMALEIDSYLPISKRNLLMVGAGANYTITDYLKENKSFKPLSVFFKLAVAMNRKIKMTQEK